MYRTRIMLVLYHKHQLQNTSNQIRITTTQSVQNLTSVVLMNITISENLMESQVLDHH